jgi:hypothetical protein
VKVGKFVILSEGCLVKVLTIFVPVLETSINSTLKVGHWKLYINKPNTLSHKFTKLSLICVPTVETK